jgi:hypothetical protein
MRHEEISVLFIEGLEIGTMAESWIFTENTIKFRFSD